MFEVAGGDTTATGLGAAGAAGVAGAYPDAQGGFFQQVMFGVLNNLPNLRETTGWNALRMSNSIMYGGTGRNHGRMRNHLDPRQWLRVTDPEAMLKNGATGKGYSIYNMSGIANRYMTEDGAVIRAREKALKYSERVAKSGGSVPANYIDEMGTEAAKKFNETRRASAYGKMVNKGWASPNAHFAETGMMGKLTTGMRLARQETVAASKIGAKWASRGAGGVVGSYAGHAGSTAAAHYMANAFTSVAGARIGGYMAGARVGSMATQAGAVRVFGGMLAGDAAEQAAGAAAMRGSTAAAAHLAGGGLEVTGGVLRHTATGRTGLRAAGTGIKQAFKHTAGKKAGAMAAGKVALGVGARYAGMAIPFVNVAMAAWLAWDIGKMVGSVVSAANERRKKFQKDVATSVKGQIEKPVFGMGYVDNEVAATARGRGVMAIQNSRLNARSVLGNEAGPLHAHFG